MFFFNDPAPTEIYTLSLHDALPISATRVFEAAGAGACLITDEWVGIEQFLEPGAEILVARDGGEVAAHVCDLDLGRARRIGAAARKRMLAEHTYDHRAEVLDALLDPRVVPITVARRGR